MTVMLQCEGEIDTLTCLLLGDLWHPHMLNGRGVTLQGLGDSHAAMEGRYRHTYLPPVGRPLAPPHAQWEGDNPEGSG